MARFVVRPTAVAKKWAGVALFGQCAERSTALHKRPAWACLYRPGGGDSGVARPGMGHDPQCALIRRGFPNTPGRTAC